MNSVQIQPAPVQYVVMRVVQCLAVLAMNTIQRTHSTTGLVSVLKDDTKFILFARGTHYQHWLG